MKKRTGLAVILVLGLSLCGCGGRKASSNIPLVHAGTQNESIVSTEVMEQSEDIAAVSDTQEDSSAETEVSVQLTEEENMQLIGEYFAEKFALGCTVFAADVNEDGMQDVIVVDDQSNPGLVDGYILTVRDGEVICIHDKEGSKSHSGGFNWFLSYDDADGTADLIEYVDEMWQGYGTCEVVEYFLDANGQRVEVQRFGVGDGYNGTCDASGAVLEEQLDAFNEDVEDFLYHKVYLHAVTCPCDMDSMMIPQGSAELLFGLVDEYFEDEPAENSTLSVDVFDGRGTVMLPQAWDGKYVVVDDGTSASFYSKRNYEASEGMGRLFELILSEMQSESELDAQGFPDYRYIGEWSGGIVYAMLPTDVQFNMGDEEMVQEYLDMSSCMEEIFNNVLIWP